MKLTFTECSSISKFAFACLSRDSSPNRSPWGTGGESAAPAVPMVGNSEPRSRSREGVPGPSLLLLLLLTLVPRVGERGVAPWLPLLLLL